VAVNKIDRRDFLKKTSRIAALAALGPAALGRAQTGQDGRAPAVKPQFSLAHLTVLGCAPPEMTYIAARAGYDFVSYRMIFMGLPGEPNYDMTLNKELRRQTRTALSTTGLKLLDIELARISDGLDPKKYLAAMEVAAELGAKHVLSSIWTPDRVWAADCYGQVCDLAKPLGLTVDLEFVTFASGKNLQDVLAVVRAAGRPNCGVMVDALHFSRSRVSLDELDAVPREWFHFAHLCDAPAGIPADNEGLIRTAREERLYPGEGGIDIAAIFNRMPPVPYSIEVPHLARVKELGYAEHAWRCLEAARNYLRAHPRSAAGL
jgi:sugar phosphate isomerase/epimerase